MLVSWVAGFVVPGAPGGIGVREGAMAGLGALLLDLETLVIVAVLLRLVTLLGEALLFLLAFAAERLPNLGRRPTGTGLRPSPAGRSPRRPERPD